MFSQRTVNHTKPYFFVQNKVEGLKHCLLVGFHIHLARGSAYVVVGFYFYPSYIYIYIYTVTYTVEGVRINHCFAICTGKREINAPPPPPFPPPPPPVPLVALVAPIRIEPFHWSKCINEVPSQELIAGHCYPTLQGTVSQDCLNLFFAQKALNGPFKRFREPFRFREDI